MLWQHRARPLSILLCACLLLSMAPVSGASVAGSADAPAFALLPDLQCDAGVAGLQSFGPHPSTDLAGSESDRVVLQVIGGALYRWCEYLRGTDERTTQLLLASREWVAPLVRGSRPVLGFVPNEGLHGSGRSYCGQECPDGVSGPVPPYVVMPAAGDTHGDGDQITSIPVGGVCNSAPTALTSGCPASFLIERFLPGTPASHTVTLQPNSPYRWSVAAVNTAGLFSYTAPLHFQTSMSASTSRFPDVPMHLSDVTQVLDELRIMRGWDGRFWPAESFVREQLATVVVRLVGLDDQVELNTGRAADMYIDAPDPSHWSTPYLITAFASGLLRGYPTDQGRACNPAGTVTFDETITIVLRALGHETDAMRGDWPQAYRDRARDLGLITPAVHAVADLPASRGEIASIVGAAVLRVPKADGTFLFPDLFPEVAQDDEDPDPEDGTRTVIFVDSDLENAVREQLGKTTGDITPEDMAGLTWLDVDSKGITDLSGLEHAVNLELLSFGHNQVDDISPLAGLTNLVWLGFGMNHVSDISPLAGLTNLEVLHFESNHVSDISPLAKLTNLDFLWFGMNQVSDISPLAGLTSLSELYLEWNRVTDISPLLTNSEANGFGPGDYIDLRSNYLNLTPGSAAMIDIEKLRARGVDVVY